VIRIALADDQALVREGLRALLQHQGDLQVVGEGSDVDGAPRLAREVHPDVIVMEVPAPPQAGVTTTERIRSECPDVGVLVLTAHEERGFLRRLLEAGVSGFLAKHAAVTELLSAIRAVAAGHHYVDPTLAGELLLGSHRHRANGDLIPPDPLSDREREVLVRVAQGYTNKEIGVQLRVSVRTVETYKARGMRKLGLRTRAELVRYALIDGWLADR
jgi:two-component system, NarL family, response regulator NreC